MLLRTRGYRSLKIVISFSSDKYSGVGLLDHMVISVFTFLRKLVTVFHFNLKIVQLTLEQRGLNCTGSLIPCAMGLHASGLPESRCGAAHRGLTVKRDAGLGLHWAVVGSDPYRFKGQLYIYIYIYIICGLLLSCLLVVLGGFFLYSVGFFSCLLYL